MGAADAAAHEVMAASGHDRDYKYFAHRSGHGIGMNGHGRYHRLRGNQRNRAPNMTPSNDRRLHPGELGEWLEDCMYIAGDDAHRFTPACPLLEQPFDRVLDATA